MPNYSELRGVRLTIAPPAAPTLPDAPIYPTTVSPGPGLWLYVMARRYWWLILAVIVAWYVLRK